MNIYHIRQLLKTKSIYDVELRVVYYARVSTDKEEQKNSILHQKQHFENFIRANARWEFCGGYIDDGISGIHAEKREMFQKMISDAKEGRFDLIITKEISRFARNTLDSIQYTRQLLSFGVCVWFQNDNINTIDDDSEFRLTIMAGVAQDEIRKLSSRVRFGHAQSIKNGVVLGNSHIYGYDKKDGKLTVNESEAQMVRIIFEKYASGEWSTPKIENFLYESGYRNYKGGKIDRGVIKHIITNPKYKGWYAGGKVKIVDMFTKKQEFLPESEWRMFQDDGTRVPAIVDEDIWERANEIFRERGAAIKEHRTSFKSQNLFTGKIFCGNDGAPYWMKQHTVRGKEDVRWVCSHRIKNGAASCNSFPIIESELCKMLADILNRTAGDMDEIVKTYLSIYEKVVLSKKDYGQEILMLQKQIEQIKRKKEKILDYNLQGNLSDNEFISRNNEYSKEIENIMLQIDSMKQKPENVSDVKEKMEIISRRVKMFSEVKPDDISYSVVGNMIKKIEIQPTGENRAVITFFLKSGNFERVDFSRKTSSGCPEYMFNNVFPRQHTVFYRHLRSFSGHMMPVEYTYSLAI